MFVCVVLDYDSEIQFVLYYFSCFYSEKSRAYWEESIRELKRDFDGKNVIIASVMAAYIKEDWVELARGAVVRACIAHTLVIIFFFVSTARCTF